MRKDVLIGIPVAALLTSSYMWLADFAVVIPLRFNESLHPNVPWLCQGTCTDWTSKK